MSNFNVDEFVKIVESLKKSLPPDEWAEFNKELWLDLKVKHLLLKRAALKMGIPYHNPVFDSEDEK